MIFKIMLSSDKISNFRLLCKKIPEFGYLDSTYLFEILQVLNKTPHLQLQSGGTLNPCWGKSWVGLKIIGYEDFYLEDDHSCFLLDGKIDTDILPLSIPFPEVFNLQKINDLLCPDFNSSPNQMKMIELKNFNNSCSANVQLVHFYKTQEVPH